MLMGPLPVRCLKIHIAMHRRHFTKTFVAMIMHVQMHVVVPLIPRVSLSGIVSPLVVKNPRQCAKSEKSIKIGIDVL